MARREERCECRVPSETSLVPSLVAVSDSVSYLFYCTTSRVCIVRLLRKVKASQTRHQLIIHFLQQTLQLCVYANRYSFKYHFICPLSRTQSTVAGVG